MSKHAKPRNVAALLNRAKLGYLSSIVFHTLLLAKTYVSRTMLNTIDDRHSTQENMSKQAKPRNVATLLYRAKLEYQSSIIFHTVLVVREYVQYAKPTNVATLL